jgi:hypothetical protein
VRRLSIPAASPESSIASGVASKKPWGCAPNGGQARTFSPPNCHCQCRFPVAGPVTAGATDPLHANPVPLLTPMAVPSAH